jgi:subtilase family serine protease
LLSPRLKSLFPIILLLVLSPPLLNDVSATKQPILPDVQHPIIFRPVSLSTSGVPPFVPTDIWSAYDFTPLYARGVDGNGTSIAIIDAYGDPTLATDLSSFDSLNGLPTPSLNTFYPDGVSRRGNSGWALETALDVEWAHAIASAARIDLVIVPDSSLGHIYDGIVYVANSLTNETVLSMSLGLSELSYPTTGSYTIAATHQLFITITSHGTTVFASSGDSGASSCCNPEYPASDPLVVAVGGTTLTLNPDASYSTESAWSGGGAGSSSIFSKPSWQQGLGDSMRDAVDVSYDADPNTGVLVVQGGSEYQVGGTSVGSPQWAALGALASQASASRFGSIASKLYTISTYHDITTGSDGLFTAGAGWDYPTGVGTPDASAIVNSLSTSIPVSFQSSEIFQGVNVTTTAHLLVIEGNLTFSGTATVTAMDATSGQPIFSKTCTVPSRRFDNSTGTPTALFTLNVPVSPYSLSSNLVLTMKTGTPALLNFLSRRIDINGRGTVDILDASTLALAYGANIGSPNYNGGADLDADGKIDILDASSLAMFYGAPDFT